MVDQIIADFHKAELSSNDKAILHYAEKLTQEPWRIKKRDVLRLSNVGFDNKSILSINLTVSYYNFVNRIANGLGIELEDYWDEKLFTEFSKKS